MGNGRFSVLNCLTNYALRVRVFEKVNAVKKRVRKRKAGREIPTALVRTGRGCEGMAEGLRKMALEQTG